MAAIGLAVSGCMVGPNYHPPALEVPDAYAKPGMLPKTVAAKPGDVPDASSGAAGTPAPVLARSAVEIALWWHALGDAELDSLVERALQANPSLEIALTRLQEARTFEVALTGYALPRIDASSGGGRGTGSDMSRSRIAGPLQSADHSLPGSARITQISGFDAVWDIDLFGKFRRQIEAARYDAQAAAAARDAVQTAVIADVVRAYIDLRGSQMQLAVLKQNLRAAQDLLDLVQARFDRGITNELDLTLAKRQFATVGAGVAPLSAQVDTAAYAIATLLGRFPEEMKEELAKPGMLPEIPDRLEPGQPLDLIRRRPDIREAEWELAGATARIGVATANLFPQLQLNAALGTENQGFGYTPAKSARIWTAGYGAVFPLLDFGTLDAYVDIADLRTHEQLVNYKRTVQAAVQDLDTAMVSFLAQQERLADLGDAVAASQRAMTLATERYDRGLTDFLNVVDAQRQEYELEGQYVFAQTTAAEQFVGVYRALGGGWEQFRGPPQIRTPQPAVVAMFRRLLNPGSGQ